MLVSAREVVLMVGCCIAATQAAVVRDPSGKRSGVEVSETVTYP